ncbi:hypothetical protein QJS10_CPA09g00926 [Acorus calamus]|uniref:Uncharacterized protein n=1 Tax=Acorus calamus TaxID=4465 RepID=A0AAV9E8Z2_ACOCL|nr:hypothetical protein QJS10_CPA09g00926 [Acorus calamus]
MGDQGHAMVVVEEENKQREYRRGNWTLQMCGSSGSDGSQYSSGSPPLSKKKRKRRKDEGTNNAATTTNNPTSELATTISKGACVLAEALLANEEREKERHKKMLSLEEKTLRIEEIKADLTKQYMDGLLDYINKLANSILALASASKRSTQG